NQLAQAETRRSVRIDGNSNDVLKEYAGETLWFTQNGQRTGVTISDTETLESLSSKINNTIKTLNNPMTFTASVVDGRLIFKSDEPGEGNVTNSNANAITYDGSGYTKLPISVDTANLSEGDFVITDKAGKTYTYGEDFDIVDGNQIRWREYDTNAIKVGDEYKLRYAAEIGDTYTTEAITRGSGNIDTSSNFNFTPNTDESTISDRLSITDADGFTYTYGTDFDFIIGTDDDGNTTRSIRWLKGSGASRPDEGVSYNINYTCGGSLTQTQTRANTTTSDRIDYYQRNGTLDVIYGNDANGNALTWEQVKNDVESGIPVFSVVDENGKSYKFGTDFKIERNGSSGTLPKITWLSTGDKPDNDTKFYVSYVNSGGEIFELDATRGNTDSLTFSETKTGVIASGAVITADKTDSNGVVTTTTYTQGTDFELSSDKNGKLQVKWLNDLKQPSSGEAYNLTLSNNLEFSGIKTSNETDGVGGTTILTGTDANGNSVRYYEGVDYTLTADSSGNPTGITWNADSTWLMPNPGDSYTLTITGSTGNANVYTGIRASSDRIALADYGFTKAKGTTAGASYGDRKATSWTAAKNQFGLKANMSASTGDVNSVTAIWSNQDDNGNLLLTAHSNLPSSGAALTYTYKHATNKFDMDDGGTGLLQALGFKDEDGNNVTDPDYSTAAQNAEVEIDGETWSLASNELDYDNDILNGVKLELKGTGTVIVDVTHDTEKAVENVQT
ncbi:MAG: hypothetical protein IJ520_07310, partial [Synergistaceae bacterium]|nr:hypothetical protein [Synergistaceae bacterium]